MQNTLPAHDVTQPLQGLLIVKIGSGCKLLIFWPLTKIHPFA